MIVNLIGGRAIYVPAISSCESRILRSLEFNSYADTLFFQSVPRQHFFVASQRPSGLRAYSRGVEYGRLIASSSRRMEASARPDSLLSQPGFWLPARAVAGSRSTTVPLFGVAHPVRGCKVTVVSVRVVDVTTRVHVPHIIRVVSITIS